MTVVPFPGTKPPPPPPALTELEQLELAVLQEQLATARLTRQVLQQAMWRRIAHRVLFWGFVLWLLWRFV